MDQQDISQKLERLKTQWILGRNRGNTQPLSKEDLQLLVSNRYIPENHLSVEEKHLLGLEQTITREMINKAKAIHLMVGGMKQQLFRKYQSQNKGLEWSNMSSEEQDKIAETLIIQETGKSSYDLKKYYLSQALGIA